MLESLFNALYKIGTFFKFSSNKTNSPSAEARASTKRGVAAATSGNNSPVYIGGNHIHSTDSNNSTTKSETEIDAESRFKNCLIAVAHELPYNFRNRGNTQNPFITQALKKLVYDEPMIHKDPELFEKATRCLNTAETLSTASPYHPTLRPADGQYLMKDLAEYIKSRYGIHEPSQI